MSNLKTIKSQTTGTNDSVSQAFSQNFPIEISSTRKGIFSYLVPLYNVEGATFEYYSDNNTNAVSTELNNGKSYTLVFSANTSSISGITQLNHKMHRVDYEDYIAAYESPDNVSLMNVVADRLKEPLITFTDPATGSTGVTANIIANRYTYTFPIRIKPEGDFVIDLFKDKAQYFIESTFTFPKNYDLTQGAIQTLSGDTNDSNIVTLFDYYPSNYEILETDAPAHVITGQTPFSGFTARGAFFTYFSPPLKPNLYVGKGKSENPVQGPLKTFTPTWNFNNVSDGDFYRLQVSYDTNNTDFDVSNRSEFFINKDVGEPEHVRVFSTPLTPNKSFIYRIGNTKQLINLFGVKQNITTWSDAFNAETANDGRYTLTGTTYQGFMSASTVMSGVTLQLIGGYSNSSVDIFVDSRASKTIFREVNSTIGNSTSGTIINTLVSDANGRFDFGRLNGGTYTLVINPPIGFTDAYPVTTRTININSDTNLDIILSILWGNNILTFASPYTFL